MIELGLGWTYVVGKLVTGHPITKRAGLYHGRIFHGNSYYFSWPTFAAARPDGWRTPMLTNTNRELCHIQRSGRFVPQVFGGSGRTLLVSEPIQEKLVTLRNMEFLPVVVERLVDLPMPPLGDFTWFDQFDGPNEWEGVLMNLFTQHDDVPKFHDQIGNYYSLLIPEVSDVIADYSDSREVEPEWSSYNPPSQGGGEEQFLLSRKLLDEYPVVWTEGLFCFREDAFAIIAPYLDLDYYAISLVR